MSRLPLLATIVVLALMPDIGNFPSYFESFVEFALADPVYGADFRRVLERLLAKSAATV